MKQLLGITVAMIGLLIACKKNDKPGLATVTTTAHTNVTSSSAQTGGTITNSGNSPIAQSGICWALHNTPTVGDSVVNNSNSNTVTFTISLTNLNANTVYFVRAFVTNGVGTSYGQVDSFTSAAGVPTITTTTISNNQALGAQSGGAIINNGGAAITASGICWSTSTNPTITNSKIAGIAASGSFTDTLRNLSLGATYYVRAYATNSYGTGYGNQVSFTVSSTGTLSDIDGNAYPTVTIGTQVWMATNLKVRHYRNGDSIVNGFVNTSFNWGPPGAAGAYTFPNGDTTNKTTYGLLYNPVAINDGRNIAPAGWHVASVADWEKLEFFLGMSATDTSVVSAVAIGTLSPVLSVGGTSNLNLQFSGNFGGGTYNLYGSAGYYGSSDIATSTSNYYRAVFAPSNSNYPGVRQTFSSFAVSIRCVKD